jgi:competence protein ComFC
MRFIEGLKVLMLNTLFPPVCVSCKKEGDFLCADCLKNLDKKKISPIYYKTEKDPDFHYMDGVIYALDYAKNPQIQAAVKQLKYRFTQDLAEHFGNLIAEKILELSMAKNRRIIFIPVPLHKARLNYRGFNQAEIIARAVASKLPAGKAEIAEILYRARETKQQAKLKKEERHENLKGAFRMNTKVVQSDCARIWGPNYWGEESKGVKENLIKEKGKERSRSPIIFLVDDVCTTGSTLDNCAEVLKSNGFEKVYGLVIARAFK